MAEDLDKMVVKVNVKVDPEIDKWMQKLANVKLDKKSHKVLTISTPHWPKSSYVDKMPDPEVAPWTPPKEFTVKGAEEWHCQTCGGERSAVVKGPEHMELHTAINCPHKIRCGLEMKEVLTHLLFGAPLHPTKTS